MSKIISHIVKKGIKDYIGRFQEVSPRDYYNENDLERTIMLYLEIIFPEYRVFPFKQKLLNKVTGKNSAADLGMIKTDYSEWYIIEIELGKHSEKDVIDQIETFRNFTPSEEHSTYIFNQRPGVFNKKKLTDLITTRLPNLMVIVNEYKNEWKPALYRLSCEMCVFQIYHDSLGNRMYRLDGDYPYIYTDFCNCKYEKALPYTIRILKTDFLEGYGIKDGEQLTIQFNGINYLWKRQDAGKEVYLICDNANSPLDPGTSRYKLIYRTTISITKRWKPLSSFFNLFRSTPDFSTFSFIKD